MAKTALLALIVLSASVLIGSAHGQDQGNRYLRPDDFKAAPAQVRSNLNQRHCLVPQDVETAGLQNLIQGQFAKEGQRDWAAYCSVNGKSRVVVVWGGPSRCSGEPFGLNNPVADDQLYRDADAQQLGRRPPAGSFWILSVVPRAEVVAWQKRDCHTSAQNSISRRFAAQVGRRTYRRVL